MAIDGPLGRATAGVFPRPIPADRSANGEEQNQCAGHRGQSWSPQLFRSEPRCAGSLAGHAIDVYRLHDVLDQMFSQVLVCEVQLRFHLIKGLLRNANAPGLRQLLQAGRDVDAFALAVVAVDNHITEIDADAHVDAPFVGDAGVSFGHAALNDHRALDRIDDAGELRQQAVAHQFEYAPLVLFDLRLEQILAMGPKPGEGIRFILLHEPGIANHVGGEDSREVTIGAFVSHLAQLPSENAARAIL